MVTFDFERQRFELRTSSAIGDLRRDISEKNTFLGMDILRLLRSRGYRGAAVDVGANFDNYSIFFSRFCTFSRVIAVEGWEEIQNILRENLKNNQDEKRPVQVIGAFVSILPELYFNIAPSVDGRNWFVSEVRVGPDSVRVPTLTLDQVCCGKGHIDLIKIDVEGHELEILQSGSETLTRYRPDLCIDVYPYHTDHVSKFLESRGYLQAAALRNTNLYFVHVGRFAVVVHGLLRAAPFWISSRSVWRWKRITMALAKIRMRWKARRFINGSELGTGAY